MSSNSPSLQLLSLKQRDVMENIVVLSLQQHRFSSLSSHLTNCFIITFMKWYSSTLKENVSWLQLFAPFEIHSLVLRLFERFKFYQQVHLPYVHIHGSTWVICRRGLMFTLKLKRHLNCLYIILFPCAPTVRLDPIKLTSLCHSLVSQVITCTCRSSQLQWIHQRHSAGVKGSLHGERIK